MSRQNIGRVIFVVVLAAVLIAVFALGWNDDNAKSPCPGCRGHLSGHPALSLAAAPGVRPLRLGGPRSRQTLRVASR
jgi:hypothetical protein